jgi:hypothetical protein
MSSVGSVIPSSYNKYSSPGERFREEGFQLFSATVNPKDARDIYSNLMSKLTGECMEGVRAIFRDLEVVVDETYVMAPSDSDPDTGTATEQIAAVFYVSAHDTTVLLALKELLFNNRSGIFRPWEGANLDLYVDYAVAIYSRWYAAFAYSSRLNLRRSVRIFVPLTGAIRMSDACRPYNR